MPNTSTAAVTAAHSCSSHNPKRIAPCSSGQGGAAADVIQFDRLAGSAKQRIADAQSLRRAQAAKALEEVRKRVTEALKLIEPFNTVLVIAPTAHLLKMCANGMGRVFDDLDHIGLVQSEACNGRVLTQLPAYNAPATTESADVLALGGVQPKGGAA